MREDKYLSINGKAQFLSIRSSGSGLPLLLYLHGGPGDAALPLVAKYNRPLEDKFTLVIWEQRGAGKSYYPFSKEDPPTIQTFIEDIHSIVTHLLTRFQQERVYLLGHSWGSVLGLRFVQQYPQLVHMYIGCGQVVNMQRGTQLQYAFVRDKSRERNNRRVLERLTSLDISFQQDTWLEDLLFLTRQVIKYGGSLYGKSSCNKLVMDVLFSPEYRLSDLLNREKGSLQSIQFLWPELMKADFTTTTAFSVPVLFMEGREDRHVSSELAETYYNSITTSKQLYWFEKSCHFPQWSESEKFNEIMFSLV